MSTTKLKVVMAVIVLCAVANMVWMMPPKSAAGNTAFGDENLMPTALHDYHHATTKDLQNASRIVAGMSEALKQKDGNNRVGSQPPPSGRDMAVTSHVTNLEVAPTSESRLNSNLAHQNLTESHKRDMQQINQQLSFASFSDIVKPFDAKGAVAIARRKKQPKSEALLDHVFYTKESLRALINSLTSTFKVWKSSTQHSWCHSRAGSMNDGLLYVKLPKCASSTAAGVAMRVADKLGHRRFGGTCIGRYFHSPASHKLRQYGKRNESTSFLWSIIREPNGRTISHFFFEQVSRLKIDPSAEAALSFLTTKDSMKKNYMLRYLKLEAISKNMKGLIQEIMTKYNFIGVSERMDESLVVLSMIMQVPVADMVLLSSKISGGYDGGGAKEGCVKLAKKIHFPAVDEYLQSTDWKKDNWDNVLFQVVNQTLDNTIDHFGRANVEREVANLRQLAAKAHGECMAEAVFPCPETLPNH